jgi:hypothetical protein
MKNLFLPFLLPTLITLSAPSSAQLHKDNDLSKDIGQVLAVGDFNGDGYMDQAIGVPTTVAHAATDVTTLTIFGGIDVIKRAGAVHVTYGSEDGIGAWLNQYWHQDSPGIPGINEDRDDFGRALAAGDFNGDGFDDLAIGSPGEAIGSIEEAGAVVILYGSEVGLRSTGSHSYHQNKPGISDACEAGDRFGASLAAGDFDGDEIDDLAIGTPNESIPGSIFGQIKGAGMVHILHGHTEGLSASDRSFTQDSPGVPGGCDKNDAFGFALATGDLNGDSYDDLVVTSVGEDRGYFFQGSGIAHLFKGSAADLQPTPSVLSQKTSIWPWEVNDAYASEFELFGFAVACGDFDGDGVDDVVIGSPYESKKSEDLYFVGAINIFLMRPSSSFSVQADLFLTQDSAFVPGVCEEDDYWGRSLCVGDLDGDDADDIIIGTLGEDIGSDKDAGMATVLYGGSGFLYDIRALHQDTPGVPGQCEPGDFFSASLSAGDFDGDGRAELSVGVPGEVLGNAEPTGFIQVFDVSSNREITWSQNLKEE